jgi:hypothetical protein
LDSDDDETNQGNKEANQDNGGANEDNEDNDGANKGDELWMSASGAVQAAEIQQHQR